MQRRLPDRDPDRLPAPRRYLHDPEPLELEFGGLLPELEIAYETWGTLAPARDNAILLCPAFSANSHASSHELDPTPGWWEALIGAGRALDTERFFVVCPSLLGGAQGTTGPSSINPLTDRPYGGSFPTISVRDVVAVHRRLLRQLEIDRAYAVIGGSLGAMEALELGVRHPRRTARVLAFSGTDWTRPYTAAIRHLGRQAIKLSMERDVEADNPALAGLRLAREIGTLFYRSRREFNQRFAPDPISPPDRFGVTFEVQSYLRHQGDKVHHKFNPDTYLALSLAMDLHNVWRGAPTLEAALTPVEAAFLNVGVPDDILIPIDEQKGFHQLLLENGKRSVWRSLDSEIGHDAFLVETDRVAALMREFFELTA